MIAINLFPESNVKNKQTKKLHSFKVELKTCQRWNYLKHIQHLNHKVFA